MCARHMLKSCGTHAKKGGSHCDTDIVVLMESIIDPLLISQPSKEMNHHESTEKLLSKMRSIIAENIFEIWHT